jgi:hypothetical protein
MALAALKKVKQERLQAMQRYADNLNKGWFRRKGWFGLKMVSLADVIESYEAGALGWEGANIQVRGLMTESVANALLQASSLSDTVFVSTDQLQYVVDKVYSL